MISTKTKVLATIIGLMSVVYGLFLTYKVLVHIEATELMWFVFWTYVPVVIISAILMKVVENEGSVS